MNEEADGYVRALERGRLLLAQRVDTLRNRLKILSCVLINKDMAIARKQFEVEHYERVIDRVASVASTGESPKISLSRIREICDRAKEIPA